MSLGVLVMKYKFLDMLKAWLKTLCSSDAKKTTLHSPWQEYETLSLIPLEELEEMIKKEQQEATQKREAFSNVTLETKQGTTENAGGPHIADLSSNYPMPPVITCFTIDDAVDPNLRITHYPPSNALH